LTGVAVDTLGALTRRPPADSTPGRRRRTSASAFRAVGDRENDGVVLRQQAASTTPDLDQRRRRPIDRTLDHAASDAARVHVPTAADVDADVAHRALPAPAKGQ